MKKGILLTAMVALLVFTVATGAFAATVYFDYTVGGKEKQDTDWSYTSSSFGDDSGSFSAKPALDQYLLGVEVPLDQFKVVVEYAKDKTEATTDSDGDSVAERKCTTYMIKGGYRLLQTDVFQLYGDLSYSSLKWDTSTNPKYSPIMIGVDGKYAISERMFVSGNLDYAVSGKLKTDMIETDSTDYMVFKVKYTYQLTKNLNAAVGYTWSKMKYKFSSTSVGFTSDSSLTSTDTGFTLGVTYNF